MMKPYGILWDMDGVLADSTQLHYQTWLATLQKRGLDFSFEMFLSTYGRNNRAVLTEVFGRPPSEDELESIAGEKETLFRQNISGNMTLLPGVLDWLQRFQSWGFPQAVASSAPPENLEIQIDSLGIRAYFQALVSVAGLPGKPDPAVFLKAAGQLAIAARRCLVLEDAPAGVAGAKKAGMKCVAVLTTHPPAALQSADLIVNRLTDLSEAQLRPLLGLSAPSEPLPGDFCPIVRGAGRK